MPKINSINDIEKKEQAEIKELCEKDIEKLKNYSNNYLNNFIKLIEKQYYKENNNSLYSKKQDFFNQIFNSNNNDNKKDFLEKIHNDEIIKNINKITNLYQQQINSILGREIRTIFLSTFIDKNGKEQVILTDITNYENIYSKDRYSLRYGKNNQDIQDYLKKNKIKENISDKRSLENLKNTYLNIKKRYEISKEKTNKTSSIPIFYKVNKDKWSEPFFITNLGYLAEPYVFFFFDEEERDKNFLNNHLEKMVEIYLNHLEKADNEHGFFKGDIANNLFYKKKNIETQIAVKTNKAEIMSYMPVINMAYEIINNCKKSIDKNEIINKEIRDILNPSGISSSNNFNKNKFFELSKQIAIKKGIDLFGSLIYEYQKNNLI